MHFLVVILQFLPLFQISEEADAKRHYTAKTWINKDFSKLDIKNVMLRERFWNYTLNVLIAVSDSWNEYRYILFLTHLKFNVFKIYVIQLIVNVSLQIYKFISINVEFKLTNSVRGENLLTIVYIYF